MAEIIALKDNLSEFAVLVIGNTQENNARIVDASTLSGAITGLPTYNLLVREVSWSINENAYITLLWEGTPNKPFMYLSSSGYTELSDRLGIKIANFATSPTGDILLSTSAAVPYTLMLVVEKSSTTYDKTLKYNN